MTDEQLIQRISATPEVMAGKPVIRGTRLTVDFILGQMAHGALASDLCAEYEGLTTEDIQACLLFASKAMQNTDFLPLAS